MNNPIVFCVVLFLQPVWSWLVLYKIQTSYQFVLSVLPFPSPWVATWELYENVVLLFSLFKAVFSHICIDLTDAASSTPMKINAVAVGGFSWLDMTFNDLAFAITNAFCTVTFFPAITGPGLSYFPPRFKWASASGPAAPNTLASSWLARTSWFDACSGNTTFK